MGKLQNDFTTPEQSKRLLELGVPADSANYIFVRFLRYEKWKRKPIEDIVSTQLFCNQDFYFPCWSVGRLIEIYNMCVDFDLDDGASIVIFVQDQDKSPIDQMIEMIEDKIGIMDFSKLEE